MALSLLALILCYVLAVHSATFDPNYPMPGSRDPLLWPFANYSIWNLPIGTSATYVAANIKGLTVDSLLGATEENIFLDNTKPLTNIYYSSAGWNGVSRCDPTPPAKVFISGVPLPTNFIVGSPTEYYTDGIFAALMPDGETITQTQPISKCNGSTYWTSGYLKPSANIYTDGIQGCHGGTGLSCLGGAMRLGEFIPDANGVVRPVRHALKTLINGGTNYYKASTYATCYRWPALGCDGSFQSAYGGTNPYLQPGSLMALPPSININTLGLRSVPALALAWTLQNYGVYVVDNLGQDAVTLCTETSPNGVYADLFAAAWKYPKFTMFMGCNQNWCNNFTQDVWVLYQNLYVVTSWTEANYNQVKASNGAMGVGGGAPRQPWAPPFVGQPTPAPTTARPTPQPTVPPTGAPTKAPTMLPTVQPTPFPTPFPTAFPTSNPTPAPTNFPTAQPTPNPTNNPTPFPTVNPTPSPTNFPTSAPTFNPTLNPTLNPTNFPTANPTPFPTNNPTPAPTANPTENPTLGPTANPTPNPTPFPTNNPTPNPTPAPTSSPTTAAPTVQPTGPPTPFPTEAPSMQTLNPTPNPTPGPTPNPTPMPTPNPTPSPTAFPTAQPTPSPTAFPTAQPTPSPTAFPTPAPTSPTSAPTPVPVGTPTLAPTEATSAPTSLAPTSFPTSSPTPAPTPFPTALPTLQPTAFPTAAPILATAAPTQATNGPTPNPTPAPAPTDAQTNSPTGTAPTASPTAQGPTSATGAPIGSVILPTPPTEAVAPTTAPLGGCWNYSAMCRKFNTDIGWMLNQLNGDAVLANYPISSLGHCADSERDMTFQFIVALAPLRDNEKKTICDAISDHMDAAFEKPSRCYYMDCKAEQRKRSEQDSAAITQFSVSVGEDAPSAASQPMPFWVYIIAAVGGLLIVLALVILIMAAFMKTRKTPEWHKYGDNDRYHQI